MTRLAPARHVGITRLAAALLPAVIAVSAPAIAQERFSCPRKGGNVVFAQEAKVNSLDMMTSSTISTRNVAMNIYESLMTRDEKMSPIPELAQEVIESPDGLTYTLKLRHGVKFHNGKPMTSEDVVASFDRYMKVGIANWPSAIEETPRPCGARLADRHGGQTGPASSARAGSARK